LPQVVNGLYHLSILYPQAIYIRRDEIPINLSLFISLRNLRLVCVSRYEKKRLLEAEKFAQQRQAAKMPAVEIRKVGSDDECKL